MTKKMVFINAFREDAEVKDTFVALGKQIQLGRTGKNYLKVTLGDRSGKIEARVWNMAEEVSAKFDVGDIVKVAATVTSYQGVLQLNVQRIDKLKEEELSGLDWGEYLPASKRDVDEMVKELAGAIKSVANPHLRELLKRIFSDDFVATFKRAPAAKGMHHAYVGGLMEHTLSLVRLCDLIAPLYPLNRDMLVTGALLHDVGKVFELSSKPGFDYTLEGKLLGHIMEGAFFIRGEMGKIKDFPDELKLHLEHMIISHHGEHEWGAPRLPATIEAMALHIIDNLDAKLMAIGDAMAQCENTEDAAWTPYIKQFERPFYLGFLKQACEPPKAKEKEPEAAPATDDGQLPLF